MLCLRFKAQGRYKQPKECNIISTKGTALTNKPGSWNFTTFNINDSARSFMILNPSGYFGGGKIDRVQALALLLGDAILDKMNAAIFASMTPFEAVRDKWSVMGTMQMLLNYSIHENVYNENVENDQTNIAHLLKMALKSSSEGIVAKYSRLGTEIKNATKLEAYEVRHPLHLPSAGRD